MSAHNALPSNLDDSPDTQLHLEIRESIVRSLATRRPILHHLNADTSWLLQIPRPASATKHGSRIYYNILIDPWFVGGQSDVARWFSQQWHKEESAVKSVKEVDELCRQIEVLAGGIRHGGAPKGRGSLRGRSSLGRKSDLGANAMDIDHFMEEKTLVDAVAISHEFTDHCHKETLLEVHPDVPVLATEQAAKLIQSFSHFRTVLTTPTFSPSNSDWRDHSLSPLPAWLSISRLTAASDALYYHSALLIAFSTHPFLPSTPARKRSSLLSIHGEEPSSEGMSGQDAAECVIYTPHGIQHQALEVVGEADPPLHTLAFLHGLHDVSISAAQQLNLGAHNGLRAQRILRAKYWIATHDEIKVGGGLIGWFLRRKVWTVEDALKQARTEANARGEDIDGSELENVHFEEVGNGESRVLE